MSKCRVSRDKPRKHGTHRHLVGASDSFLRRNLHVRTLLSRLDQGGLTWEDVAADILPVFERAGRSPTRSSHRPTPSSRRE